MKVNIGPYPKGKSKRKRSISVKIDNYDLWSLDHTLALIILPALKQLKALKHGAPGSLFDLKHHKMKDWKSKAFKVAEKKSHDAGFKKWYGILDEMIYSFERVVKMDDTKFHTKKGFDQKAYLASEKKIDAGLVLFGTYFRALWT